MQDQTGVIPFGDLFQEGGVRFARLGQDGQLDDQGQAYMSVRDIIGLVCRQDKNHAARTWRGIPERLKKAVNHFVVSWKFAGEREKMQPVITFKGALALVMMLPNENAKKYRLQFIDILTRYFAGDATMAAELQANAASANPVSVLAREALAVEGAQPMDIDAAPFRAVEKLAQALVTVQDDLTHERFLRHQADGRYGSEVREATQVVREANADLRVDKRMLVKQLEASNDLLRKQLDAKDKQLDAKDKQLDAKDRQLQTITGLLVQHKTAF